ncbi:MAG: zinc ABC transporter substrate-binding protein [Opitutales bacterium]|nr:zinc ABC transporter substrate-binding protein [Opitutales bacterium]
MTSPRINGRAVIFALASMVSVAAAAVSMAEGKLRVAATTTMVADLAESVAGDNAIVTGLMGPGVDPHLYKATASDINTLQSADLILYNGLHLEGRLADLLVKLARRGKQVYAVTENLPAAKLLEPEEFQGHYDPHVWFDPRLWAQCVDTVVEALSSVDSPNKSQYAEQGELVKSRYLEFYNWGKQYMSSLAPEQRYLVTSHDAYNYFGRAFDFQVIGVQGISTQSEAGLADIVQIVKFIKGKGIRAIFVESSVSPASIQRISQDSGASIGGELFSDAMGTKGHMGHARDGSRFDLGTYEGMVKGNISTITDALAE